MADANSTLYGVIYCITNKVNGKVYIGQTTRELAERWQDHCRCDSYCWSLQGAIKKYGKDSFAVTVLDTAKSKEDLDEKEILHISLRDSINPSKGYNLRGGGSFGKHTEESKKRMSIAVRKAYENPEFRLKLSAAKRGKKRSQEYCAKASTRMTGTKLADETKRKLSNHVQAMWQSEEYKQKVTEGQTRARSSEEYRQKVAEKTKAQWGDPEQKEKLKAAQVVGKLAMWADPVRKAALLAKRNATNAAKRAAKI